MIFTKIQELRKANKLKEALELASVALEKEPENIWNKRAAGWVFYDFLKEASTPEKLDIFLQELKNIANLHLPPQENIIFDNCAWKIGSMLYALSKQAHLDFNKLDELFDIIKNFHFTRSTQAYTFLYKAFHQFNDKWDGYLAFADWWGFENFCPEDYEKTQVGDNKIMAIAEQAYYAYSRKLISEWKAGKKAKEVKEKIQAFLPKLDSLLQKYPHFQFLPYFKTKLELITGTSQNILSTFLPFARLKKNEFWVWELLAELFPKDKEIQFVCYCKALSLKVPEEYLINTRYKFVPLLIEKQLYNEAKTEINNIIKIRKQHQWKIPEVIQDWLKADWYQRAVEKNNNSDVYQPHLNKAEKILYQDIAEEIVVVQSINSKKFIINFIQNKNKKGFFKYEGLLDSPPEPGDVLRVRFKGDPKEEYYKVLTIEKAGEEVTSEALQDFEGIIKINTHSGLGFVRDIFIPPSLIEHYFLVDGENVKGRAVLSFDEKKKKWGWKAVKVIK
ncbi:MAG: hypothetical protein NZ576_02640 [Bacteroidia bacterium]|nr:hypothetical protein [Bacteroidia bacterium]